MTKQKNTFISFDPWHPLTQLTPARIGLGRTGMSLPTRANLDFQLAHALARDAINIPLNFNKLTDQLNKLDYDNQTLKSQAENQSIYLQRPDLGRLLSEQSSSVLSENPQPPVDVVIIVTDGLSSKAIQNHAISFLQLLVPALTNEGYLLAPINCVKHGRVAIGDAIAEHYNSKLCITLIGERPGLSSPDSMGIYFTYRAKAQFSTDADRNCISNIHANGLSYEQALIKLFFLIKGAEQLKLSGVNLKDETTDAALNELDSKNFLIDS